MNNDQKIDEILNLMRTERELNNTRFTQLSSGVKEIRKDVNEIKVELKDEINKVYMTLLEDMSPFATDLKKIEKRVDQLERKRA